MSDLIADIQDVNLSYLIVAQQLVRTDRSSAIFRLGVDAKLADLIGDLSPVQVVKLASTSILLARLRLDDASVLGMLTHPSKERRLANAHASILMAAQQVEKFT